MKQEQEFYKERAVGLLTNFQLLELTLKLYIGTSYDYINSLVGNHIYFDFSVEDIENYSLERLLNLLCSGQLILATFLEFNQNNRSDSLGVSPPLY